MELEQYVGWAARLFEAAGVLVMTVGALIAPALAYRAHRRTPEVTLYRFVRRKVGGSILLGLELLVAADIIRTVSESPTLMQVAILGGIVLIRTFLSFTLEVELEGRWPWQKDRARPPRAADTRHGEPELPEARLRPPPAADERHAH